MLLARWLVNLRNKIVERLVKDFGERDAINPWDDVYDNCVYRNKKYYKNFIQ